MSPCSVSLYRVKSKYRHLCCFGNQKHQNFASVQPLEMDFQRKNSLPNSCIAPLPHFGSLKYTMKFFLSQYWRGGQWREGEEVEKERVKLLPLINGMSFDSSRALKFFIFLRLGNSESFIHNCTAICCKCSCISLREVIFEVKLG